MRGPLLHTIVKEFLVVFRDPSTRNMFLVMPVIQLLVFSFAATMEARNVSLAVVDGDGGRWSREFVQRVAASDFVGRVLHRHSLASAERLIVTRDVLLVLHLQPDFSRRVERGEPARAQVLVDGRRANTGQLALSYLRRIADQLRLELAVERSRAPLAEAEVRHWFNPNLEYRWFIVTALLGTLAMMPAMLMSTLGVARDRELGTLDQLVVSPVSTFQIILGKALPAVFAGMVATSSIFVVVVYLYRIPYHGNAPVMLLAILVFTFAITGIGLTVSACCSTQQRAFMGAFSLVVPLFITSGFITPVENMPHAMRYLAELNPLKHVLIIVQGSFLRGLTAAELWPHIWPMLLIGATTMGVAGAVVRWRIR